MDQSQDISDIFSKSPQRNSPILDENHVTNTAENERPDNDPIEPFDFGFERSFANMNLEFTNSYRFEPSTSYMRDFTEPSVLPCATATTSFYEPNSTLPSTSKYSKQVGIVSPNISLPQEDGKSFLQSSKSNILSIINLLNQNIISYPFVVCRRQAQVNNRSAAYHLHPFAVLPFMVRVQAKQGVTAIFKGLSSSLVSHVILISSETLFYNLLQLPIECSFTQSPNIEIILKHLALKALSYAVVTPFLCSSSVESVQSLIVSESSGPLDCISEGLSRIFHFKNDRKFGFIQLVLPSVSYHLLYYVMFSVTRELLANYVFNTRNSDHKKKDNVDDDEPDIVNELKSSLYANILTDVILYPLQTVLFRLFLQGTRTLIDNVDQNTAVIPLISNYESAGDCYEWIVTHEGTSGLFKGFGALILQYGVQASLIELANYCIETVCLSTV